MQTPDTSGLDTANIKRTLRINAKRIRSRLTAGERNHASGCLAQNASEIQEIIKVPKNGIVGGYYPMGGEIDSLPLMDWMRQLGWRVALPVVENPKGVLAFREWKDDAALVEGFHGIQHPDVSVPNCLPNLLLVPLLAFDAKGRRLGYGGGFYDRTLAHYSEIGHSVTTVGVAFSKQEIEAVPCDDWDYNLDKILTERGVQCVLEDETCAEA